MGGVRSCLKDLNFDMAEYREEAFGPSPQTVSDAAETIEREIIADGQHLVRFEASNVEVACAAEETILVAGRKAGVRILSVCEMGICGTCKVRKISGDVAMEHNGGITKEEIDEGYILACCAKPHGPITIEG